MGPPNGGWDVTSNATSYIDDGYPSVYRDPLSRAEQSDCTARGAKDRRQELDSTPRSATRVQPINGDLLQRLFRATWDEKRRMAEEARAQELATREVGYVLGSRPRRRDREPGVLYIPKHLEREVAAFGRRDREEGSCHAKKIAQKTTPRATVRKMGREFAEVHVRAGTGEQSSKRSIAKPSPHKVQDVDVPVLPVEEELDVIRKVGNAVIKDGEQDPEPVAEEQDLDPRHKKTKKQCKQNGKKQRENNERAAASKLAANAIMSGALQAEDEASVDQKRIAPAAHTAKASSAGIVATLDQLGSSRSRQCDQQRAGVSRSGKSTSTRSKPWKPSSSPMCQAPSTRATSVKVQSEKAEPFVGFGVIGQGWAGEFALPNGSGTSKASPNPGGSVKWSTSLRDTGMTPAPSYPKASRLSAAQPHISAKLKGSRAEDWEEIVQSPVAALSEARDEWGAGPGTEYHAPSVCSLDGAATGWTESHADRSPQEFRSSIRSRLVSIDGGKAVALDWGEETLGRSRANQIVAKNLFNIPILGNIGPAEARAAQASPKAFHARIGSTKTSREDAGRNRISRASHRDIKDPHQVLSDHASGSVSAHEFEEAGNGWYQRTREVGRSFVSRSRSQSPLGMSLSYRAGQDAGSKVRPGMTNEKSRASSFHAAQENAKGWSGHERADSSNARHRAGLPVQPSVHDWADARPTSRSLHERNAAPAEESGPTSVSSGYGWEDGQQSRYSSRSDVRVSCKQPIASSRHSHSEDDHEYYGGQAEGDDRHTIAWPGTGSEEAIPNRSQPQDPREHPTIFAGKGWISPHPLSKAPSAVASPPQSRIALPKEAYPQRATMTYEEWQQTQEQGLKRHRNFSQTESDQTRRARHHHSRYRFAGWGTDSSDGYRFEQESSKHTNSRHVNSRHSSTRRANSERSPSDKSVCGGTGSAKTCRPPTATSERSSEAYLSGERPRTITSEFLKNDRSVHEIGASSKRESLLNRIRTLTSWSPDQSGSKQAYDRFEGAHSSRRSSRHSSGGSNIRQRAAKHSSQRHSQRSSRRSGRSGSRQNSAERGSQRESQRSSRHASDHRSMHNSHRHSTHISDRRSMHISSVKEREMEVMEEGGNVWSEVPEYDGTTSNAEQQERQARSEFSRTATSELYLNRYRPASVSSNGNEF